MTAIRYPNPQVPNCGQCNVPMEAGVILDQLNMVETERSCWVPGSPTTSLMTGLKLKGKLVFPVTTYRCPDCGLLRSYAFRPSKRHG